GGNWFDDHSLFCKAVHRTLSDEQTARYEKALDERRVFRYRASVGWVVVMLGSNLGWNDEQRQRFEKILLEETRPPKKFAPADYYVVLYQAARLPEVKFKPIFDDLQWRLLSHQLQVATRLGPMLKNSGFVPDEEPVAAQRPRLAATPTAERSKPK